MIFNWLVANRFFKKEEMSSTAWLYVISAPNKGFKLEIFSGNTVIGRDRSTCHLILGDSKVSRCHASINLNMDGSATLIDRGSSNGSFLRGQPVNGEVILAHGDVISVGNSEIIFLNEIQSDFQLKGTIAPGINPFPPANYTRILSIQDHVINIGRDPSNDLILNHPMVSRNHAHIIFKDSKRLIFDLNSANGTYVNGSKVNKSMVLQLCLASIKYIKRQKINPAPQFPLFPYRGMCKSVALSTKNQ